METRTLPVPPIATEPDWRPASFFRAGVARGSGSDRGPASARGNGGDPVPARASGDGGEGNGAEVGRSIVCTLCPFECALGDGDTGRCHVRRRRGARLETATFATAVVHAHPIERKPFYHVRPGTRVLTLAAPGCMFTCTYCQNYRLSQFGRTDAAPWAAVPIDPAEIVARAAAEGMGIAFSYSEPVLAAEATLAIAPLASQAHVPLLWKTNGFITEDAACEVAPALTAANVDLKAAREDVHLRLTGAPLGPVVSALRTWKALGVWLEVSTPVIPGTNDDLASLQAMAQIVVSLGEQTPWHLLRFHPDHRLTAAPPTHPEILDRAVEIARAAGLVHVYVERALGDRGRITRCVGCGEKVVERHVDGVRYNHLREGRCPRCRAAVAGCW